MRTTVTKSSVMPCTDRRVLRVVELENLGISQSTSYRQARPGGPWTRLAPGVLLIAPGPPTIKDRINAALLRAGPGAMITGLHAARLLGLRTPPEEADIHVLIPHRRKVQSYPGTNFERTTRLPKPIHVNGIPLAPPVRAVMDGARTWQTWTVTESLLFEAIQQENLCRFEDLVAEMELGSRRGTAVPRAILRTFKDSPTPFRGVQSRSAPPAALRERNAA
ncbi:hypothetical protein [Saccharopolyspora pogona]|uniref:hypothetical protein n=1 Tax=Saccharopolyspora pogona TaxID=333966 RepID=UPI001CC25DAD|nr:hypothetical protein [Saccharopolyspora pogona]